LQDVLLVEYHKKSITLTTLESLQGCLNYIAENAIVGSFTIVVIAGTNIILDFFLLIGTCCKIRCLLLPWLLVYMIQLILLGCPIVISFSLLGTYLLLQGEFLLSLASFSMPTFLVLMAMAIWLTVLAAFWTLGAKTSNHEYSKATAKARLAKLDGYKGGHGHGHHGRHEHGAHGSHGGHNYTKTSNIKLYPSLPLH